MMKRLQKGLCAALGLGAASLGAASAQMLEEIMQDALDGSQSLAADRAALDAQREATRQARSGALPSLSVSGFASENDASYDPGADGDRFLNSLGVSSFDITGLEAAQRNVGASVAARQTVFAGGRIVNSIRAAKAGVRAAEASFSAGLEDKVFEIVSAYYDVVRVEAQTEALRQSLVTLTEQDKAVRKSFELGRATRTDVASVDAQRADVEARHATARAQVVSARLNFQAITGLALDEFVLTPELPSYPDDVDRLVAIALASNPNLEAIEAAVEASDAEVRVARGQRLPAVEIAGAYTYAEGNLIEGDSLENASVQLQMSVPLFAGGRISSEVRQAKAELRSNRLAQADLNRRVESAVRAAYGEAIAAGVSRRAAETQLEARALAFEGATIEADLGKRSTLELLDAEDDLLSARFTQIDARIRERLTIYNLLRLTGSLSYGFGVADAAGAGERGADRMNDRRRSGSASIAPTD